jgi:hypothetical protein
VEGDEKVAGVKGGREAQLSKRLCRGGMIVGKVVLCMGRAVAMKTAPPKTKRAIYYLAAAIQSVSACV